MSNFRQTFILFFIILVFGSGLAIYVWNLMNGRNLTEPPEFDYSVYDDMSAFGEIKQNLIDPQFEPAVEEEVVVEESPEVEEVESSLENGNIYFKKSFGLSTAIETNDLVSSFMSDFLSEGQVVEVENLEALNKVIVELPALERESIIVDLSQNEVIKKVTVVQPPEWEIEFNQAFYEKSVIDFLAPYNGVILQTSFPTDDDHIAKINIFELQLTPEVLEKLETEYSDVLTIVLDQSE